MDNFTNNIKNKKFRKWKIAIIFGVLSTISIVVPNIYSYASDLNVGGETFSFNFLIFFPLLSLSVLFGIISFVFLIKSIDNLIFTKFKNILIRIVLPIFLLIPLIFQLSFGIYRFNKISKESKEIEKQIQLKQRGY